MLTNLLSQTLSREQVYAHKVEGHLNAFFFFIQFNKVGFDIYVEM